MKCVHCDAEIEQDSLFCTNCGKEIAPSENEQQENNGSTTETSNTEPQTVMTQPEQAQPITQEQVMTPTPQMVQIQQMPQAQQKKNNIVWIVVGAVIGAVVLLGIIGFVILSITLFSVENKIVEDGPSIFDYGDYGDLEDGKVIKKIKDPTGHEITIIEDSIYIVKTETYYLYDEARDLRGKAKIATKEEADRLEASEIEKMATKKVIDYLSRATYSIQELTEKLEEDGFNGTAIKFAIENCGVDWEEQTKIKAIEILAAGGFSKSDLISLLEYEGYDAELAKKAAEDKKMNYYEQAVYNACFYKYTEKKYSKSYSRQEAEKMLKNNGYKDEEIRFALTKVYDEMDD